MKLNIPTRDARLPNSIPNAEVCAACARMMEILKIKSKRWVTFLLCSGKAKETGNNFEESKQGKGLARPC
jgi:hypothetical protein